MMEERERNFLMREIRRRGKRSKMEHVPYGTNTITKKVINACQYKKLVCFRNFITMMGMNFFEKK